MIQFCMLLNNLSIYLFHSWRDTTKRWFFNASTACSVHENRCPRSSFWTFKSEKKSGLYSGRAINSIECSNSCQMRCVTVGDVLMRNDPTALVCFPYLNIVSKKINEFNSKLTVLRFSFNMNSFRLKEDTVCVECEFLKRLLTSISKSFYRDLVR